MTLRMYAEAKGLPLERASATVEHQKIHAIDCADCETREGRVDRLQRTITLEGELTAEQRTRLLQIADKCPVHQTLESEVSIVTTLAE
jgi:putative redox protein